MKKILLSTIALVLAGSVKMYAQQEPQFTHYMFNKLVFNPAAAGVDANYATVTGLYHNQWTDFKAPDGETAPITETASFDGSIHPEGLESQHMYIGLGFHFLNDREAWIGTTGFIGSASFHFEPKFGGNLSIGVNAGQNGMQVFPPSTCRQARSPGQPLMTRLIKVQPITP
jgi:type IX secretion system PorP/SprF family membrane protein